MRRVKASGALGGFKLKRQLQINGKSSGKIPSLEKKN